MFKWASKQKDRSRHKFTNQHNCKTSFSPAHSNSTFKSLKSESSYRKLSLKKPSKNPYSQSKDKDSKKSLTDKFSTPKKQNSEIDKPTKRKNIYSENQNDGKFESNKRELSEFLQNKLNSNYKNKIKNQLLSHKKIVIKLALHNNLMLSEYINALYEVKQRNWSPYAFATLLQKMGFIQDLVNDRYLVKQVWEALNYPCPLSVYVLIEKIMGNRIDMDEAQTQIKLAVPSFQSSISHSSTQFVLSYELNSPLMNEMKNRRIARKESLHY